MDLCNQLCHPANQMAVLYGTSFNIGYYVQNVEPIVFIPARLMGTIDFFHFMPLSMVLWCSEEHLSTANYRMQQALNTLEGWTNRWLVKINSRKTTYTIFSLSTKEQKATLHISGQTLLAEDKPTYLGVTFDKRLTWKQQTEKAEARAKVQLALMKKLAGTTWGADTVTLK